jgi:hypothetical protein
VVWDWRLAGQVMLADGKLVFPRVPDVAGMYRLTLRDSAGARTGVYLGEADLLPRRYQHYRTPGASQQTNMFRVNQVMVNTLASRGRVTVEISTDARVVAPDGVTGPLDRGWKAVRVLVERARPRSPSGRRVVRCSTASMVCPEALGRVRQIRPLRYPAHGPWP